MKKVRLILILSVMAGCASHAPGPEEIPFRVNKVSDRITIFIPGRFATPAPTNVITTDRGLIVIDTGLTPTLAEATKKRIKRELGRDDVRFVINTHYHFDHTNGNQVYARAEIIGHGSVPAAMQRFFQGKDAFISSRRNRIGSQEERLKTLDPESEEAKGIEETNRFNRLMIDDLLSGYMATPPTKTFSDRMDMREADLELRLYYFGRAHTDGDILVHVPALGVLFIGDLFHQDVLGVTADPVARPDIPRWLEVLGQVLENESEVKTVIGGHGMVKDRAWLAAQFRYVQGLWDAVGKAKTEGTNPEGVEADHSLEKEFGYLSPYFDLASGEAINRHRENIRMFWRVGLKPASEEIERVLRQSGVDASRARFQEVRTQLATEYYVDEREFNALGYKFLHNERKGPEAVAVFEMNAEAFPHSWNVWDSLAEAYMWGVGDREKAKKYYQKSLDLNPNSQSAKDNLSQIRGYELDAGGQTKALPRFQPGQPTGIRDPYFGQTPPGFEPEVFAPGIVSLLPVFGWKLRPGGQGGEGDLWVCFKNPDGTWGEALNLGDAVNTPATNFCSSLTPDGNNLFYSTFRDIYWVSAEVISRLK